MITQVNESNNQELTQFIYEHMKMKEYFVGWIPENYEEIAEFNKEKFFICIENGQIVGFLGTYVSLEQKVVRLLGPIIEAKFFNQYADALFDMCMKQIPMDMKEVKIAFFQENTLLKKWFDDKNFELYNAEIIMEYNKASYKKKELPQQFEVKLYEEKYKEALAKIHPQGVFYTLEELVLEAAVKNQYLLLGIYDNEVVGYTYFLESDDKTEGEILLLHVREDQRNKGYGSILLNQAITTLVNHEIKEIIITVKVTNVGAKKLYKRSGFSEKDTIYAYKKQL